MRVEMRLSLYHSNFRGVLVPRPNGFGFWYPMLMSLTIFGADNFLIPTMICILIVLTG